MNDNNSIQNESLKVITLTEQQKFFNQQHKREFFEKGINKRECYKTSLKDCNLNIGDIVQFENCYGIIFEGYEVLGFYDSGDEFDIKGVYLNIDCYWYPIRVERVKNQ